MICTIVRERKKSKCDYLLPQAPTNEQVDEIVRKVNEVTDSHLPVYEQLMSILLFFSYLCALRNY